MVKRAAMESKTEVTIRKSITNFRSELAFVLGPTIEKINSDCPLKEMATFIQQFYSIY